MSDLMSAGASHPLAFRILSRLLTGQLVLKLSPGALVTQWYPLVRRDGCQQLDSQGRVAELLLNISYDVPENLQRLKLAGVHSPRILAAETDKWGSPFNAAGKYRLDPGIVCSIQAVFRRTLVSRLT